MADREPLLSDEEAERVLARASHRSEREQLEEELLAELRAKREKQSESGSSSSKKRSGAAPSPRSTS